MSKADLINGIFEALGSIAIWTNVARTYKAKGYAGFSIWSTVFFTSWGFWNTFYYPHLDQWLLFAGGVLIATANVAWITLLLKYGKKA